MQKVQGLNRLGKRMRDTKDKRCDKQKKQSSDQRQLHILSWNCNGGTETSLTTFINTYQPDIIALQECNSQWLDPPPNGYKRQMISENQTLMLSGGQLTQGEGRGSFYAVLYQNTFKDAFDVPTNLKKLQLLNYFKEEVDADYPTSIVLPKNVSEARPKGFAARVPAVIELERTIPNNGKHKITLFNWHAYKDQDGVQNASFDLLKDSVAFRKAIGEAAKTPSDLVIIAADLNNELETLCGLKGVYQKFDHILANSGSHTYEDKANGATDENERERWVRMEADRKNLITKSGDHTAVAALIDY